MASIVSPLLVLFLVFSHHVCLNAVPFTRIGSLVHGRQVHKVSENTLMVGTDQEKWEQQNIGGRKDIELDDYPGLGANNRHTPKPPPYARLCAAAANC
ncbi:hypothetical protein I3843_12G012800 [Carya illinoinensis]|uniref:Uncharacterized protein n=1 Tax=Carya illinoinensis TaxID=32201 RepID=A0A8T1NUT1_CARIL|nr:hypothetical protein I3760_12G011900 [Carya illinoinensis]KAG6632934.1 hypothetical protein CIPAW_12G013000 [Carya illinoinensis]KAG6683420.1 hypothetical protein I3842_12G011700 [Carya illinoinensis]KAG7951550.1 hypothetical protein I3843_12G012800 [Carya illinoinensis]